MRGTFAALESPTYRVFWLGALLSFLGFFTSTVVQSIVAFELTHANRAVGLTVLGQGIAMLSLGPIGGALADRVSKRAMLFLSQSLAGLVFLGMGILLALDLLVLPLLIGAAFGVGACISVLGPARQAYAPELVRPDQIGNAAALNQVALNATRIAGPALAGALLSSRFGASGAYFTMAGLYALAVVSLLGLPPVAARKRASTGLFTELGIGLRYVARHRRLRRLILYFTLVIMTGFPYVTVMPGLVKNALLRDADTVSWLFAISAAGGLAASLGVARLADSPRAHSIYSAMALLFGASLIVTARAPSITWAAIGMIGVGIGTGGFQTLNGAVVLRETEPMYYGRVMSLTLLAFGAFGIVGYPIGIMADAFGERTTLTLMGVTVCAISGAFTLLIDKDHGHPPGSEGSDEGTG